MTFMHKLVDFFSKKSTVSKGGGDQAISKQKAGGKLTARERIAALLDPASFHEYDLFVEHNCKDFGMHEKELAADGVITGSGGPRFRRREGGQRTSFNGGPIRRSALERKPPD